MDSSHPPQSPHSSSSSSAAEPDIEGLQQAVRKTNSFSAHIALINGLRQAADLTRLRESLQQANALYPLPESVWLNYLTDETPLATTLEARQQLLSLHSRAVADFSTPTLHARRLIFAASLLRDHEIDDVIYKQLLEDAKLHGAGYSTQFKTLCKGLPLVDAIFESPPAEATVFQTRLLQTPPPTLGTADQARITAYSSYARFAESLPSFAISIYETALSEAFFSEELWKQYDQFLCNEKHSLRSGVLQRACRVLPHELDLWRRAIAVAHHVHFLELLERVKPYVMQSNDLSSACRLTKEVWNRFFALGCPENALNRVMGSLEFNVVESVEWVGASCHAAGVLFASGDSQNGEKLMDGVVGSFPEARWWLLYADMVTGERRRKVYERALRSVGSIVEVHIIRDAWEIFELSFGGDGIVERMQVVADGVEIREGEKMPDHGERRFGKPAKRRRGERGMKTDTKREKAVNGSAKGLEEEKVVDKMEEVADKQVGKGVDAGSGDSKGAKADIGKTGDTVEPNTVFVSNLAFSVKEEDLREEFSSAGSIKEIRLPKRNDGASKGFAYIEFGDDEAVVKALTKHNKPVKGRAAWVQRSKPPVRKARRGGGGGSGGRGGGSSGRRGGTGRGGGSGGRGRGRRVMIHAPKKDDGDDGDVVMEDKDDRKSGLVQDDFRKMLG